MGKMGEMGEMCASVCRGGFRDKINQVTHHLATKPARFHPLSPTFLRCDRS
jgi:hypothetical protein